jgi:AAA domain
MIKPTTHQRDLAKLPRALAPLIDRDQWAVWRWTQKPDGTWQKPPFQAHDPERHASTNDPATWADYATALATVQAGHADGLSYVLTADDPFGAIDIDHCRCTVTNSIDIWAQNYLEFGRNTYTEVTPSGTGCRIWGLTDGVALNRKFNLKIDEKDIAVELFRRTNKALTITGYRLDTVPALTNVDELFDWAVIWGERRKAAAAAAAPAHGNGNGFDSGGSGYSIDEIEQIVRTGAPEGANRSDLFHTIVGHYVGCQWEPDRIAEHLGQFPEGIGARYLAENRLTAEVERSAGKFAKEELPNSSGWAGDWQPGIKPEQPDPELEQPDPELEEPHDPDLDDDLDQPQPDSKLPPLHAHGDADPRPLKSWLIKNLLPQVGKGLISGQWGAGKTFVGFELTAVLLTGQPFHGHMVKRQCGVLWIAAEGAGEVRLRLDAVIREKCGNPARAPFRWYEAVPALLERGATDTLITMAKQADASLQAEFGLPLGAIFVDTIAACAGYRKSGDEQDNAVGAAIMNVLDAVAQALGCFVFGIDHFGKDLLAGTRGASSKESAGDVVLACLGEKQVSGSVNNTRLAVRKQRGGRQGQEYPFLLREVELGKDEDGDAITTMVVDWQPAGAGGAAPPPDPWSRPKRQDQRTAVLRLKRVLMAELAEQGVDLPIAPDGPVARMIDQEIVRERFYAQTSAEGTSKQKRQFRNLQFKRALGWAEDQQLIGVGEIGDVTYVWLARPDPEDGEDEQD